MVKTKKKIRVDSEAVNSKKSKVVGKKLNPFEVHVNKEKFRILGRKHKHDRGLPGTSRSKAIQKRKQTLGKEYKELHKVNKFKDRRIGSGAVIDEEELANARFTAEKIAQFKTKRSDIFNLNDDEILTHRGQTLEEIEQFNDPVSDESEDEELDAEFTEAVHFGGDKEKVDRNAVIEEKIMEAKRKKIESLKEKEEVYELTKKLDANYKEMLPLIGKFKKDEDEPKPKQDDYDRVLKEMIFEPRGEVTDKLQSEEEIARKEKQRLEKLEKERLERMLGEETVTEKPKHRSADDLDDGYLIGLSDEEEVPTLAYELEENKRVDENKESDEEMNDDDQENGSASESESDAEELKNNSEDDENEEEEDDDDSEDEDALDDLKGDESESENEINEVEATQKSKSNAMHQDKKSEEEKEINSNDNTELQYTYDIPLDYESLKKRLNHHTPINQGLIIDRTLKYNHPKLDPSNREKIVQLFTHLLKYLDEIFSEVNQIDIGKSFKIFNILSPYMYDIVNFNPKVSQSLLDLIIVKYNEYKKNSKQFPSLNTIIFFKLVSNLYSTSDFRHPIVTPCFIFISHILSRAKVRTRRDISFGLFIVTIFLEYTRISKRLLPAVYNYLLGICSLCIHKKSVEIFKVMPPFSSMNTLRNMLVLNEKCSSEIKEEPLKSIDLVEIQIDDSFKIHALNTTLKLMRDTIENICENVGVGYYAELYINMIEKLNLDLYPKFVKQNHKRLLNVLNTELSKPLQRLVALEKKPKALRLMEPRIEKVVDDKRRPKMSKEKVERAKLMHKVKRETKGAVREIRRDTAFITKMKIKEQIQSDMERKEKVRRIYAEAAAQQGELNELARKRKKM